MVTAGVCHCRTASRRMAIASWMSASRKHPPVPENTHQQYAENGEAKTDTEEEIADAPAVPPSEEIAAVHERHECQPAKGGESADDVCSEGDDREPYPLFFCHHGTS